MDGSGRKVIGKGKIFMCEAVQSKVKLLYPGIKQSDAAHLSCLCTRSTHRVLEIT